MELRHLRYFLAVAEELHFGRAAKRLGISQPPLSQQIRNFEEELGVELFKRNKRHVQLTPAGEALVDRAQHILKAVRDSSDAAKRAARGEFGELTVAYGPYADLQILPGIMRGFVRRHPLVQVRLLAMNVKLALESLKGSRVDLALTELPLRDARLEVLPLLKEPVLLACPSTHPIARAARVSMRDLNGLPYVHLPREEAPAFSDTIQRFTSDRGISLKSVGEPRSVYDTLTAVASGLGVTLLPQSAAGFRRKFVRYRRLRPPVPLVETAIVRRSGVPPSAIEAFLGVARRLYPLK